MAAEQWLCWALCSGAIGAKFCKHRYRATGGPHAAAGRKLLLLVYICCYQCAIAAMLQRCYFA
jgi:hypothetical protein